MIKNLKEIIAALEPADTHHFSRWLTNRIEVVLKMRSVPMLLPYENHSNYGVLAINSAEDISINNFKILYDF